MVHGTPWTIGAEGNRVYSEMHLVDWWWQTQYRLPPGGTILTLICGSDEMQLTEFSSDK